MVIILNAFTTADDVFTDNSHDTVTPDHTSGIHIQFAFHINGPAIVCIL